MELLRKATAVAVVTSILLTTTEAVAGVGLRLALPRLPASPLSELEREGIPAPSVAVADGLLCMLGQEPDAQHEQRYTYGQGMLDGEKHAEKVGIAGKFATGLLLGVWVPFIGTGIGYFLLGNAPLDAMALMSTEGKGEHYLLGFRTGWNKKSRLRKRNAFVVGGVLGTLALLSLGIYYPEQSD